MNLIGLSNFNRPTSYRKLPALARICLLKKAHEKIIVSHIARLRTKPLLLLVLKAQSLKHPV